MKERRVMKRTGALTGRLAVVAGVCAMMAVALAKGDAGGAERAYKAFKEEQEALRKATPEEGQRLVDAICAADEDERASVAEDMAGRVKDRVQAEYDDLAELEAAARQQLDAVLGDSALESEHGKASERKKDVQRRWASIQKMTKSLRGANHPVVAYMLDKGINAHRRRQKSCDVAEHPVPGGKIDCLEYTSSACYVVELKPDNPRAIKAGNRQIQKYAEELKKKKVFESLVARDKRFAQCKGFEVRVDCYTLCPNIDADGEYRAGMPTWRSDCE